MNSESEHRHEMQVLATVGAPWCGSRRFCRVGGGGCYYRGSNAICMLSISLVDVMHTNFSHGMYAWISHVINFKITVIIGGESH